MKEYRTITQVAGPLVFVEKTEPVGYHDARQPVLADGSENVARFLIPPTRL